MRAVIFHHHLFKNAGTSVDEILSRNFPAGWVEKEFATSDHPRGNTSDIEKWIIDNPAAVAFSTHSAIGPIPEIEGVKIISILLLRDPIERIKSVYRFERNQLAETFGAVLAKHTDFPGYVRVRLALPHDRQLRNFQTGRLARMVPGPEAEIERATKALKLLDVVGMVSEFSDAMERLAQEVTAFFPSFEWAEVRRNTTSDRPNDNSSGGDPTIDALLESHNEDDFLLLQRYKEIFKGK